MSVLSHPFLIRVLSVSSYSVYSFLTAAGFVL